jgi:hypothetical protein
MIFQRPLLLSINENAVQRRKNSVNTTAFFTNPTDYA